MSLSIIYSLILSVLCCRFLCQADAPLQEAIEAYDRAYKGSGEHQAYSAPPLAPYLNKDLFTKYEDLEGDRHIWDTCYLLISLYCQRCQQLEQILNPATSTASQLDYRLR